jgi:predicted nuclease of predicted toxin-antitoxin system
VRLLLDEHYPTAVAARLRDDGCDAVTVQELGAAGIDDAALLRLAAADRRALVTSNARDFVPLARRWMADGASHHGIVLTSDRRFSRSAAGALRLAEALLALHRARPGDGSLENQTHWL